MISDFPVSGVVEDIPDQVKSLLQLKSLWMFLSCRRLQNFFFVFDRRKENYER